LAGVTSGKGSPPTPASGEAQAGAGPPDRSEAPTGGRVGRPRGPRRSRDERRTELLDAAERAIQRIGPTASMDELAAEAGITKPILYSHFGDKAGLAQALAVRVAAELGEAISTSLGQASTPQQIVASTIGAFCSFIENRNDLYRFLIQTSISNPDKRARTKLIADFAGQISVVLGGGLRQVGADSGAAEPWSFAIVGMTLASGEWWLDRRSMSKDDLVSYLTQLLWSGLAGAGLDKLGVQNLPSGVGAVDDEPDDEPDDGSVVGNVTPLPGRLAAPDH
jgi:AcrR family transcriptional regulator